MNYSMLFAEKQSQPATCRLAALTREQKLRFQQGDCRFPVAELAIERHLHQFFQRMPLHVQEFAGDETLPNALFEFGEPLPCTEELYAHIGEHGDVVARRDAVATLQRYFC